MALPYRWGDRPEDEEPPWACEVHAAADAETWVRAVDVDAPPATVFRWLCQLRAAPYSYDWIDNLGRRSPRSLTPGLEELAVGQSVMSIFELVAFEPGVHLTLATRGRGARLFGRLLVTYRVTPHGEAGSRLAVRLRVPKPRGVLLRLATAALAWGDWVMMRKQLLTLKRLAEGSLR